VCCQSCAVSMCTKKLGVMLQGRELKWPVTASNTYAIEDLAGISSKPCPIIPPSIRCCRSWAHLFCLSQTKSVALQDHPLKNGRLAALDPLILYPFKGYNLS